MPTDPVDAAVAKQVRMQARVARASQRLKRSVALFQPLQPFVRPNSGGGWLLSGIAKALVQAIDKPGVAPTTKPKASDGSESFHFSLTTVTKGSPFTRLLTGEREGAAAAHESYIERDNAPEVYDEVAARRQETLGGEKKAARADALEIAIGGQAYIERKGALEETEKSSAGLSMYGNLPETFEDRLRFWEEVEKFEREPRNHFLSVDPALNPALWNTIEADPDAPPELARAATLPQRVLRPSRANPHAAPRTEPGQIKISEERALAVRAYLNERTPPKSKSVATFTPGRGGHVQSRLIVSLPYELSADDRLALLKAFCDEMFRDLDATDASGKTIKTDVPFWAVVHKPEATSDDRNYHAHIVFSERPAKLIQSPQTGEVVWDFAYSEKRKDKARVTRSVRPFVQDKLRSLHDINWPRKARHTFAYLANDLLLARGINKKLDPRSYEAMGILQEPLQRLKPNAYAKAKKGETPTASQKAVDAQWDRIVDDLDQRFPLAIFRPEPWMERRFDMEIRRWRSNNHPAEHAVAAAKNRWRIHSFNAKVYEAEAAAGAVAIEKIRSRIDSPAQSLLPKHPELEAFLDYATEAYVHRPRQLAAHSREVRHAMERYVSELAATQGPTIGNPMSVMLHSAVPSMHPHKIRMIDNLAALSQQVARIIEAGEDVDISAMHRDARAAVDLPPPGSTPAITARTVLPEIAVSKHQPLPYAPPNSKGQLQPRQTTVTSSLSRDQINTTILLAKAQVAGRRVDKERAQAEWALKRLSEARGRLAEATRSTPTLRTSSPLFVNPASTTPPISPAVREAAPLPRQSPPVAPTSPKPASDLTERSPAPLQRPAPTTAPATAVLQPEQRPTQDPATLAHASHSDTMATVSLRQLPPLKAPEPPSTHVAFKSAPIAPLTKRPADPAPIQEPPETTLPSAPQSPMPKGVQNGAVIKATELHPSTVPVSPTAVTVREKTDPEIAPENERQPGHPPELPPDPKALEHRRKRRRVINAILAKKRDITR